MELANAATMAALDLIGYFYNKKNEKSPYKKKKCKIKKKPQIYDTP